MRVRVYRNLDRPFTLFGIKGKFIAVAGAIAALAIIAGIVAGSIGGLLPGLIVCIAIAGLGYLGITEIQNKVGTKALERRLSSFNTPKFIVVNSKVWKRST